jgi:hypothetical protein
VKALALALLLGSISTSCAAPRNAHVLNTNVEGSRTTAGVLGAPSPRGDVLRALTTAELRNILAGSYIEEIVPNGRRDLSTPEKFNSDGRHVRYTDNREIDGKYTLDADRVCVHDELDQVYCRFMLMNRSGQYFFSKTLPAIQPVAIFVRSVRK